MMNEPVFTEADVVANQSAVPTVDVNSGPQEPDGSGGSGNSTEVGGCGPRRLAVGHDADDVRRRSTTGARLGHYFHLVGTSGLETFHRVGRTVGR